MRIARWAILVMGLWMMLAGCAPPSSTAVEGTSSFRSDQAGSGESAVSIPEDDEPQYADPPSELYASVLTPLPVPARKTTLAVDVTPTPTVVEPAPAPGAQASPSPVYSPTPEPAGVPTSTPPPPPAPVPSVTPSPTPAPDGPDALAVEPCPASTATSGTDTPPTLEVVADRPAISVGEGTSVHICLSSAPKGLAGFDVTFVALDEYIAEVIAVEIPEFGLKETSDLPDNEVRLRAADLADNISFGSENILLATLRLHGKSAGSTGLLLSIHSLDDDEGENIDTEVSETLLVVSR